MQTNQHISLHILCKRWPIIYTACLARDNWVTLCLMGNWRGTTIKTTMSIFFVYSMISVIFYYIFYIE